MTKFLKLTNLFINLADVSYIQRTNTKKYIITMRTQQINGFMVFGSGQFNSSNPKFTVCEKEHADCYKLVDKWFNEN